MYEMLVPIGRCHTCSIMIKEAVERRAGDRVSVRIGGLSLIVAAVSFMTVFSYLAAKFQYPEVLDGTAGQVLPALLATGSEGRVVWAIYAFLPLFWIPAATGAFQALREKNEGVMRMAMLFAVVSSLAMVLGLARWPSFHWELARAWASAPGDTRLTLEALFLATNRYLGNYLGEFLGELAMNVFFLLTAITMLKRGSGFGQWVGWLGMLTSITGFVAMFRNISTSVAPIAAASNYLLPLWMIVFGVSLLRFGGNRSAQLEVPASPA
jgi:hypothetical protein